MSDPNIQPPDRASRLSAAVNEISRRLKEMGVNPDAARAVAKECEERIFVGGAKSPIMCRKGGSLGEFYPAEYRDPLGALISEVFTGVPDAEKLVAVERREQAVAEFEAEMEQSGRYRL